MLLSRDALVSVQEKLRWQVLDRHLIVVLRLLGLCCHTWRCGSCFQASHFSVGFYYHIAARVILDRILLSVLYVLSQFYHHVVFDWTWIHRRSDLVHSFLRGIFDFRVLRILLLEMLCLPSGFAIISATAHFELIRLLMYASTWSCDIKNTNCHQGSSFSLVPPLMPAASLVLFAALGLSEESSSFARECCEHSFTAENVADCCKESDLARRTTA